MQATWQHQLCETGVRALLVLFAAIVLCLSTVPMPALAQGFKWPWEEDEPVRPAPQPPARINPDPYVQQQPGQDNGGWSARTSICLDLERRLVQETANSGQSLNRIPQLDSDIAKLRTQINTLETRLDRGGCYEEFLFTRTLRQTPQCTRLARTRNKLRRDLAGLEAERQDLNSQSGRSYQDEIVRELARNNCGSEYVREANRRNQNVFRPFWEDQDGGSGYANSYRALPFATYRTLCVRLCDGYYFPVSFSTLPNHFQRDSEVCQSKCAAPAALYYHQNPGAGVEQMVSAATNEPYTQLKEAFLYRKKYIDGCSCKQAEYLPQTPAPVPATPPASGDRAQADPDPTLSPFR